METETYYRFGLAHLPSFGQARLTILIGLFGSAEELWNADIAALSQYDIPTKLVQQLIAERAQVDIDARLQYAKEHDIVFVPITSADYPGLLKEISDPPLGLFVLGALPHLALTIGMVGTRKPSAYGTIVTRTLATELARSGIAIVSGLALGVDGTAHKATVAANGKTVAVIGSGLDGVYPRFHSRLAQDIVDRGGAVISEFAPGTPPLRHHFPIRNRIIAGLCQGVIVTEAPEKSGALLTAMLALEYNRDVFAVPGPVTIPSTFGTNTLLKNGAQVVRSVADVLDYYHMKSAVDDIAVRDVTTLSTTEQDVLRAVPREPSSIDQITEISTLDASVVNATLTLLHMKGWIEQVDAFHYVRIG